MFVPFSVNDFLLRGAQVYGERVGVVDEPDQPAPSLGELTYAEVRRLATAMAARHEQLGLGVGDRVAMVSHNSARLLTAFFGVSGYGRVLVPINFRLSADEVAFIVAHSGAQVLYVDPELVDALAEVDCKHKFVIGEDDDLFAGADALAPTPWEPDENATATINYTSGTTARPKGVQLTHRNLWTNALTFGLHAGVSDRDVYLHTLPMFHCNGWGMPFVMAGMGVPQIVLRKVDGPEILRRVAAYGVTVMCAAPAVVAAVLDAAPGWLDEHGEIPGRDRVRIIVAGAPPPTKTIQRVQEELGWEFIQIYGLTETSPLLTINRTRAEWDDLGAEERAARLVRAGAPAIGVTVQVDEHGEVLARSNVCLEGYWDNPEESERCLAGGWFHTGDGGVLGDDGYLTIQDRKKDVIITGGENVSSIEVEDAIFSHPDVAEVAVIGVPDEKWGETIKALVVRRPGGTVTEAELIDHVKSRLARYKAPSSIEFRDVLARTATGKLQKFKLRAPYWEGRDRQVN